ncbi:hypothetical protein BsWGS_23412 [Bradybaena similaris]
MGNAKALLVALAIVFAAAQNQRRSCHERLEPCNALLPVRISVFNPALRSLVDNIDSNCTTYQQAVNCVQPLLSECSSSGTSPLEIALSEWEYICSARGRSLLREANSSRCYTDNEQLSAVPELIRGCLRLTFQLSTEDLTPCQFWQSIVDCANRNITEQCGQAVGAFFSEHYRIAAFALIPNCPTVNST